MQRKSQKPPHPPHPHNSGDMPWLDPGKLPSAKSQPAPSSLKLAIDSIQATIRSLPNKRDRHQVLGIVLARMVESEHIRLNDIWQTALHETNRYNHIGE
jgi:hypothetical protein